MVLVLRRKDRAIALEPESIFAGNHPSDLTVEGVLEGYNRLKERPEIQALDDALLEPETQDESGR